MSLLDCPVDSTGGSRMLTALMVLLRSFRLICSGHRATVLENLALRQQFASARPTMAPPALDPAVTPTAPRPAKHEFDHSRARPHDVHRESVVGSAADPRANWESWASPSRSGPCRGCCVDHAVRRHRRGGRFSPIMSRRSCRWTSSPCPPSPAASCSSWSCSAISAGESSMSTSRNTPRRRGRPNRC